MLSRRQFIGSTVGLIALALPVRTSAQTPSSVETVDPELWRYLSLSPLSIANLSQPLPLMAGNPQLQAEALDIAWPIDMANPDQVSTLTQAMYNVAVPSFVMNNALRDDFSALTGFDVGQISSGAEIGEPPDMVTFLRGDFDLDLIRATQIGLGYQQTEVASHPVSSLSPDGEFDLSNPVQTMALARMNNFTVLDDGTLVYAATLELIHEVLTPEATLASLPELARAMATLDAPLITSMVLGPENFLPQLPIEIGLPMTQDEIAAYIIAMQQREPAPIVLAAIAGNTPGGPVSIGSAFDAGTPLPGEKSLTKFALAYASSQEAETAAAQIEERLATLDSTYTQQPWAELFASWSAVANVERACVLLTIEWIDRAARTTDLIFRRDLGFITG